METTLMRAGITKRDYAEECADWAALANAVDNWSREEEQESIDYALGRRSGASSKSVPSASERQLEKDTRRGAMEEL